MRRMYVGGGGSKTVAKNKPKDNSVGSVVADMIKAASGASSRIQKAGNEARAKQMPSVAKKRGFHVSGGEGYYSNARGQVAQLSPSDIARILTGSNAVGMYGPKVFQNGFRQQGIARDALLASLLKSETTNLVPRVSPLPAVKNTRRKISPELLSQAFATGVGGFNPPPLNRDAENIGVSDVLGAALSPLIFMPAGRAAAVEKALPRIAASRRMNRGGM